MAESAEKYSPIAGIISTVTMVLVLIFLGGGGWSAIQRYIDRWSSHEKLAAMHYHGEWSLGEYRECASMNIRQQDKKPELDCSPIIIGWNGSLPMDTEKVFNVKFSGDLTYDEEKPEDAVHYWLCRRNDAEPSFSCGARENPAVEPQLPSSKYQMTKPSERQLTDPEIENLRKRNECEQRFYDKKIYEVDGRSVMLACKQNPDRKP